MKKPPPMRRQLPLVMIHGFLGGGAQWDSTAAALAPGVRVIAPDLPGFGGNARLAAPSAIADFADAVLALPALRKTERFYLLGHSMGGMIAQEIVRKAPARIAALILYATGPRGTMPGRFETVAASRRRVLEEGAKAAAARIAATWFLAAAAAPAYSQVVRLARRAPPQSHLAGLTAMARWDGRADLRRIAAPTLIIWGSGDRSYRFAQIQSLWRGIPGADLAVIPGAAHFAHLEKPDLFSRIVGDFLTRF